MKGSVPHSDPPGGGRVPFAVRLIATGFWTGYIPWASGTFGSLAGLLIALIPGVLTPGVLPALILCGFFAGVHTAGRIAQAEGHALTRSAAAAKAMFQPEGHTQPDPSIVVIDEIVGMWLSILWIAPGAVAYGAAFVLFRLFDVLKPEPARSLERLRGGWGIMLDDVVAGVYANAATRIVLLILSLAGAGGILR